MQTLRIVETSGRSPTLDDFSFDRQKDWVSEQLNEARTLQRVTLLALFRFAAGRA